MRCQLTEKSSHDEVPMPVMCAQLMAALVSKTFCYRILVALCVGVNGSTLYLQRWQHRLSVSKQWCFEQGSHDLLGRWTSGRQSVSTPTPSIFSPWNEATIDNPLQQSQSREVSTQRMVGAPQEWTSRGWSSHRSWSNNEMFCSIRVGSKNRYSTEIRLLKSEDVGTQTDHVW